jgi:hypothetical protein
MFHSSNFMAKVQSSHRGGTITRKHGQAATVTNSKFEEVIFTNTLSQAVAEALKERSEITDLHFLSCFFPYGGDTAIASALVTNPTLMCFHFYNGADKVFYEVLPAALQSNSTLQNLSFDGSGGCSWLPPFSWLYE